jgi:hypothetical protein
MAIPLALVLPLMVVMMNRTIMTPAVSMVIVIRERLVTIVKSAFIGVIV